MVIPGAATAIRCQTIANYQHYTVFNLGEAEKENAVYFHVFFDYFIYLTVKEWFTNAYPPGSPVRFETKVLKYSLTRVTNRAALVPEVLSSLSAQIHPLLDIGRPNSTPTRSIYLSIYFERSAPFHSRLSMQLL